jgi:hypothetical protein
MIRRLAAVYATPPDLMIEVAESRPGGYSQGRSPNEPFDNQANTWRGSRGFGGLESGENGHVA